MLIDHSYSRHAKGFRDVGSPQCTRWVSDRIACYCNSVAGLKNREVILFAPRESLFSLFIYEFLEVRASCVGTIHTRVRARAIL